MVNITYTIFSFALSIICIPEKLKGLEAKNIIVQDLKTTGLWSFQFIYSID